MDICCTCVSGLEEILDAELTLLFPEKKRTKILGGVVIQGTFEDVLRCNLHLRTASRVLVKLFHFYCSSPKDLYKAVREYTWDDLLTAANTIMIAAPKVFHPDFSNSLYAAQLTKDAICDYFNDRVGTRPSVDLEDPDFRFVLFINNTYAEIYYDTSGWPLYKRGIKGVTHEAPLKETLAAAIALVGEVSADSVVCDPCCGSGTILLEAALIASKRAPGLFRAKWAFEKHPQFNKSVWERVQREAHAQIQPLQKGSFIGIDISGQGLFALKTAAEKLGILDAFEVLQGAFQQVTLPKMPTVVLTNPPYGYRLQEADVKLLHKDLGDFMKRKCQKPATGVVLTMKGELAKSIGLRSNKKYIVKNSSIDCRIIKFDLF